MFAEPEHWHSIAGYEGAYEVSDGGRVRSLPGGGRRPRILRASHALRYDVVGLSGGGSRKSHYVHHLVAAAFIGPRPEGLDTCHNDGNPRNNTAANLRYDTRAGNMRDAVAQGTHRSSSLTHCKHGHELTPDNLYVLVTRGADGGDKTRRRCRVCRKRTSHLTYSRRGTRTAA